MILGAQGTICGGGRYDGLVEKMGGNADSSNWFCDGFGANSAAY